MFDVWGWTIVRSAAMTCVDHAMAGHLAMTARQEWLGPWVVFQLQNERHYECQIEWKLKCLKLPEQYVKRVPVGELRLRRLMRTHIFWTNTSILDSTFQFHEHFFWSNFQCKKNSISGCYFIVFCHNNS